MKNLCALTISNRCNTFSTYGFCDYESCYGYVDIEDYIQSLETKLYQYIICHEESCIKCQSYETCSVRY
jgi:hypothetical protein